MDLFAPPDWHLIAEEIAARLRAGQVGILPTDTLYGLSGDARSATVVERILRIKGRMTPMSVVPPTLAWAASCLCVPEGLDFSGVMESHRGAYTLLWPSASSAALPAALTSSGKIGLRLPGHWITELAAMAGLPLLTTSANRHGEQPMTTLEDLDPRIAQAVDFVVYEGPRGGPASTIIVCDGRDLRVQPR